MAYSVASRGRGGALKPWLLNLNFTTPHWPWEGPDGHQSVSDELTARVKNERAAVCCSTPTGAHWKSIGEMVRDMDTAIGQVMGGTEPQRRALDNTLVFFASDNGGERVLLTWPLSGAKGSVARGRNPRPDRPYHADLGRANWGSRQVSHKPVVTAAMDWTATFLELAGAQPGPGFSP